MAYQAKIEFAYDEISGKLLEAEKILKSQSGYQYRNDYADGNVKPICIECNHPLSISGGLKVRPHFRHLAGSENCLLLDKITMKETEIINQIYRSKESDRHKELKNKIGERLKHVKGVSNIWIDDKFIIDKNQKKKPDVYCEFNGKKIVFEIQLSNLSNKYIRSRYHFYKRNEIFLVWVLDDLDLVRENKNTMSLDIKHLAQHQNLFKLDENANDFRLNCSYKDYYIDELKVKSKWREKSLNLNLIKFSTPDYQVFFKNGLQNKEIEEQKLIDYKKQQHQRIIKQENDVSKEKIQEIFNLLRYTWEAQETESIVKLSQLLSELSNSDLNELRDVVDSKKKNGIPFFNRLIINANIEHLKFINLILFHTTDFGININRNTDQGETVIQSLSKNQKTHQGKKEFLIRILNSGYKLQKNDLKPINSIYQNIFSEDELILLKSVIDITYLNCDVEEVFANWKFICLLSSIKQGKFIGFHYRDGLWLAFANNAIDNYKHKWKIIEESFKIHEIWPIILKQDKKGTFQKKYHELIPNLPKQDRNLDQLIDSLFPEISSIRWVNPDFLG